MKWIAAGLVGCGVLAAAGPGVGLPDPPAWQRKEKVSAASLAVENSANSASASRPIAEMEAAYLRGEYALVVATGQRVLQEAPASAADRLDDIWYLIGLAQLQLQQPDEARRTWIVLLDQWPGSRWRPDAETGVADALWMSEEPARAVALYQAVLARLGPGHPASTRAQYQLGQAARQAGQWTVARQAFEGVIAGAPQSFEAGLARAVLQQSDFTFSVQVGAFGVRDNAVRLQRQLAQRGYSAMVDQALADGRVMHRVRVGRFSSREQATEIASRLRQDGFPSKIVP
ncbi:MAG: SPOR domain-containing protein [Candidatus Omnitrophica bacterium]|nr:SPOR domain-containing protein [Candidatus Omnitrophota bacterium]